MPINYTIWGVNSQVGHYSMYKRENSIKLQRSPDAICAACKRLLMACLWFVGYFLSIECTHDGDECHCARVSTTEVKNIAWWIIRVMFHVKHSYKD